MIFTNCLLSLPSRGAWIEIVLDHLRDVVGDFNVAPLAGSVQLVKESTMRPRNAAFFDKLSPAAGMRRGRRLKLYSPIISIGENV